MTFVGADDLDADKAKKEAFSAAAKVSSLLVESVNGGVQESFVNEKRIEMEARALAGTVQRFTKQSAQWLTVFHTFDSALKVSSYFGSSSSASSVVLCSLGLSVLPPFSCDEIKA